LSSPNSPGGRTVGRSSTVELKKPIHFRRKLLQGKEEAWKKIKKGYGGEGERSKISIGAGEEGFRELLRKRYL